MNELALLASGSGGAAQKTYVDDVFSTYLYTGNGSTQTINNGIDLAGKGGLVWIKSRSTSGEQMLTDTVRGVQKVLLSNSTDPSQDRTDIGGITAYGLSGFGVSYTVSGGNWGNQSGVTYASWTFRKAPKFFDVVTYIGDGTWKTINHSLGVTPGMVITKALTATGDTDGDKWNTVHRSHTVGLALNTTSGNEGGQRISLDGPTSIRVGGEASKNGIQYVAYLFAHDTGTDGIIQAGSFTTNSSGVGSATLGFEPQWLLTKKVDTTGGDWNVFDSMRGMPVSNNAKALFPNTSGVESATDLIELNATGFTAYQAVSSTYIYLAIRRPNKPPISGTQVFSPRFAQDNNNNYTSQFDIDLHLGIYQVRNNVGTPVLSLGTIWQDRLRGVTRSLTSISSAAEVTSGSSNHLNQFDANSRVYRVNNAQIGSFGLSYDFRRAPGVFDVVCYTGTGTNPNNPHSLGVPPELVITKSRSSALSWTVDNGANQGVLNTTAAFSIQPRTYTSTTFQAEGNPGVNYVAYLFASLPGISKVGSYTGNGSSQTINCGFTTGARFILIKRTDSSGDWYTFDTARGIVAANDPRLSLNTSAAEVTTDDSVDPDTSGFIVNQNAATNINVSSASYIFLAIA